ncbi:signal peptidase I [Candidatus Falkowbacteria bacterium]|nr:signal peptidase I [Candidatus Falkowbacteria bacterium]
MRGFFLFLWETIKIVVVSALIVVPIRYFVVQPFFVKGASMEPGFDDGHYLIINEISYRLEAPERGDVIVFRYPLDPSQYYIKRIIGLPGETVEIVGGGVIIYNQRHPAGMVLVEDYLVAGQKTTGDFRVTLRGDEYFVLGDNREASSDSRRWGPLDKDYIIGRVWVRAWPPDRLMVFAAPNY